MKFFKHINLKICAMITTTAKKKIIEKIDCNSLALDNFTSYDIESLVKNEESIVVCNVKRIGSDLIIGVFFGMWVYAFMFLYSQKVLS